MSKYLTKARLEATNIWKAAAYSILQMNVVETDQVPTMAVDKHWRLYYNPEWLSSLTQTEATGVILHEVSHLILGHAGRAESLGINKGNHMLWNLACDCSINSMLADQGIRLPKGAILPESYNLQRGMVAEWYFMELMKNATEVTEYVPGGSCADGIPRDWEDGEPSDECPGLDEVDAEVVVHKTAEKLKERGNIGGELKRLIRNTIEPNVDPQRLIMQCIRAATEYVTGQGERTYRRPSRRPHSPDMSLPSSMQPVPRIVVIVDTSGSMSMSRDIPMCAGLILKVINNLRIRDGIKVVTGDTSSKATEIVFSDPTKIEYTGGGGTDMGSIIEEVVADRPKPDIVFVATDGETPWPESSVGVPVIACLTQEPHYYTVPSWIKRVDMWKGV